MLKIVADKKFCLAKDLKKTNFFGFNEKVVVILAFKSITFLSVLTVLGKTILVMYGLFISEEEIRSLVLNRFRFLSH